MIVDNYPVFYRMLLNHGRHENERILSRAAVKLMTMDYLTPRQRTDKNASSGSSGYFDQARFGFGIGVRTYRRDFPPVGQFGWDGGLGTSAYAVPAERLTGILLAQTAMDPPHRAPDPGLLDHGLPGDRRSNG